MRASIRPKTRRGASSIEVVVAFTLLSVVLTAATSLVVRHGRLLQVHRDYQVALDEVSNQLERLTALPPGDVPAAVAELKPSTFASEHLPGAELRGTIEPADLGQRVTVELTWDESQGRSTPVTLAAWILPTEEEP